MSSLSFVLLFKITIIEDFQKHVPFTTVYQLQKTESPEYIIFRESCDTKMMYKKKNTLLKTYIINYGSHTLYVNESGKFNRHYP